MRIKLKSLYRTIPTESHDERMYRISEESHWQNAYRRLVGEARGASQEALESALETLNGQIRSNPQAWTLIARYAGRVEREARKLDSRRRAEVLAQQLVDRGTATELADASRV